MMSAPALSATFALLDRVLAVFLAAESVDKAIGEALAIVGSHFGVSRAYIFENEDNDRVFSNTYEWVNEGIKPCKALLQRVPFAEIGDYYSHFDARYFLHIPDINTLQEPLRDLLAVQGIRSMLQVAFVRNDRPFGMIGFDDCGRNREWSTEEAEFLSVLARLVAVFVLNRRSERRSRQYRDLAFQCIEQMDAYVYVIDVETYELLHFNEKIKKLSPSIRLGQKCYRVLLGQQNEPCSFCPVLAWREDPARTRNRFEFRNQRFDLWAEISSAIFEWFNGRQVCFMCGVDVSARRRSELKLEELAFTDELTGIPNNRKYERAGPEFVDRARRGNACLAVIVLKLENLHRINSLRGHKRGDKVLRTFAEKGSRVVPGTGLFARIRGNDFAILCPFDKRQGRGWVHSLLLRILEETEQIAMPASAQGALGLKIGVALFPRDGRTFEELSRKAELAAPGDASQKNAYAFYDEQSMARALERERLSRDMARALPAEELEVFHQPKCEVRTLRIAGTEALLRWHHPELGLLTGGQFIPLAEELNQISALDDWVLDETCRQIRDLLDRGCPMVPVSINFSPDRFYRDGLVERLQQTLQRHAVAPEYLEVELTERLALEDIDKAAEIMRRIRELGVKISIDDFGTGYSSLNYLRMLPLDVVKVDRTFAQDLESDPTARDIVRAIVSLSHLLGAKVVFEGIETSAQFAMAKAAGCELIQGFFTGVPMSADDLEANLRKQPALPARWAQGPALWRFAAWGLPLLAAATVGGGCFLLSGLQGIVPYGVPASGMAICAALAVVLGWRYTRLRRTVDRSLLEMIRACREVWRGNAEVLFPVQAEGRLGELATALQTTARKVRESTAELCERERILETLNTELCEQHEKYRIVAGSIGGVVWELNMGTKLLQFASSFTAQYGHTQRFYQFPDELLQLIHPDEAESVLAAIEGAVLGDVKSFEAETRLRREDGAYSWIRISGEVMYDEKGVPEYLLGAFVDLDEHGKSRLDATHGKSDILTGLRNRLAGKAELSARAAGLATQSAFILVDIDKFRELGQQYGRLCGDSVLREVVRRLLQFVGGDDVLFRYNVDVFALFKAGCDESRLAGFMEELLRVLEAPYSHHRMILHLSCTAGVALLEPGGLVDEAEGGARDALKQAKLRARGAFLVSARGESAPAEA